VNKSFFKRKGFEKCNTEHKLILTHLVTIFNFTVFHILNRNLPQGMEVWPPGSHDINPFDYLKCGVSRRGISRSYDTKKQSLITTTMAVFSNIPREAAKRACSCFLSRLEKVIAAKGDFIR
jgi:hypothetical protein